MKAAILFAGAMTLAVSARPAHAFCGFYVAAATGDLYNDSSQVVITRDGDRTTISMFNDYKGDPKEFALVVPVPPGIKKQDVKTIRPELFAHLDQWSAPRLVEYWEQDPCGRDYDLDDVKEKRSADKPTTASVRRGDALGVKIEAKFSVGEYDILVLSAKQATGLETWLKENHYNIPAGAAAILKPYIESKTQFFVAKVNLKRLAEKPGVSTKSGIFLSPLSFGFKSKSVSLPIRLGTINGHGTQDLIIFMISKTGRFQVTNYANPEVPTDLDVPEKTKDKFKEFYLKMFDKELAKHEGRAVFTEYAWQSGWCDPCSADPIPSSELKELGLATASDDYHQTPAFVTRLHARYTKETFTKDLEFRETADQQSFQGRYIIRHPWKGKIECKNPRRGNWGASPGGGGGPVMPRRTVG